MARRDVTDDMIRRAAPGARLRWAGAPAGFPAFRPNERDDLRAAFGSIATALLLVAVTYRVPGASVAVAHFFAVFGAGAALLFVGLAWIGRWWSQRRTEYRITTAGIFVTRGSSVHRFDLPESAPWEHRGTLWFRDLGRVAVARDGRSFEPWRTDLLLAGLGLRTADVRAALVAARGQDFVRSPAAPPRTPERPWWWTVGAYVFGATLLSPAVGLVALFFAMIVTWIVGEEAVRYAIWWLVKGARLRSAWTRSHPPLPTNVVAERLGAGALLIDEVRAWLAHSHGIPMDRLSPDDTLASLRPLSFPRLTDPDVTTASLIARAATKASTVGELIHLVDAALAENGRPSAFP